MKDSVSLIIPCRNEEKYISKCLESILRNDYPKKILEVLIIDGMSYDKTRQIVNAYSKKYPFIKLIDNPKRITPSAMNISIKRSKGDYIIIMIAHGEYPKTYISDLIKWHKKLKCDNVGGLFIDHHLGSADCPSQQRCLRHHIVRWGDQYDCLASVY